MITMVHTKCTDTCKKLQNHELKNSDRARLNNHAGTQCGRRGTRFSACKTRWILRALRVRPAGAAHALVPARLPGYSTHCTYTTMRVLIFAKLVITRCWIYRDLHHFRLKYGFEPQALCVTRYSYYFKLKSMMITSDLNFTLLWKTRIYDCQIASCNGIWGGNVNRWVKNDSISLNNDFQKSSLYKYCCAWNFDEKTYHNAWIITSSSGPHGLIAFAMVNVMFPFPRTVGRGNLLGPGDERGRGPPKINYFKRANNRNSRQNSTWRKLSGVGGRVRRGWGGGFLRANMFARTHFITKRGTTNSSTVHPSMTTVTRLAPEMNEQRVEPWNVFA